MGLTVVLCCLEIEWTGGLPLEVTRGSVTWNFMGGGDWNAAHRGRTLWSPHWFPIPNTGIGPCSWGSLSDTEGSFYGTRICHSEDDGILGSERGVVSLSPFLLLHK